MSTRRQAVGSTGACALFVETSHSIPLVSIVLALRTGAALDPPSKEGLARVATRMLRRGHRGMSARDTELLLDRLGAELLVDTTASSVAIHGTVLRRNLEPFIDLLALMLAEPTHPEEELGRLQRETVAELSETLDNDRAVTSRAFARALFGAHPYGRSAAGSIESVPNIARADVIDFHKTRFGEANLVVGFSGDITETLAAALTARLLSGLPATLVNRESYPAPEGGSGTQLVFVDKPDRTQSQIAIGTMGSSAHDDDHVPLLVGNAIFGGTFTSRLMKAIRTERGWSYGAGSRISLERHRHAFQMYAAPAVEDAPACAALMLELYGEWVERGVTDSELEFVKNYIVRSHAFEIDTANKRLHHALDVELLGLPEDYFSAFPARVSATSREEVNRAIGRRLSREHLVIAVLGTAASGYSRVREALGPLESARVVPYDAP